VGLLVGRWWALLAPVGMAVGVGLTRLVRRPATQRVAGRTHG